MAGFFQYLYTLIHLTGWEGLATDHAGHVVYGGSPVQAFLEALQNGYHFALTASQHS
jgi:hypothetical protein